MADIRLNITVTDQVGAVTASVQESMAGLGRTTDTVQGKMSGFSSVLAGFGGGVGLRAFDMLTSSVGALVSSLPAAVSHLVNTSGAITDLAARSGFGTEALRKFSFAGGMVGVTAEEIATVVEGIARIPDPAERSALAMELLGKGQPRVAAPRQARGREGAWAPKDRGERPAVSKARLP